MGWRGLLGGLALCVLLAAPARATTVLTADSTTHKGHIDLTAYVSTLLPVVQAGEIVDGKVEPIGRIAMNPVGLMPPYGLISIGTLTDAADWRCDRRDREFTIAATDDLAAAEGTTFTVRTPSCADRLRLDAPAHVAKGAPLTITLNDSWETGGTDARVCVRPPRGRATCNPVTLADGQSSRTATFPANRRGKWRITVRAPFQRITRTVGVGKGQRDAVADLPTIVTTGDSMMQSLDSVLQDTLKGRAHIDSDVRIGSAFTKPFIADWTQLPGQQVAADLQQATIIFLGANDDGPIAGVPCCGPDWIAGYRAFAHRTMLTYSQRGTGAVLWINLPVPGDDRRVPSMAAVDQALQTAADGVPRARVIDAASIITPGDADLRQPDTIHLSLAGARLVAQQVIAALADEGVITP